jgi:hypothetical protein
VKRPTASNTTHSPAASDANAVSQTANSCDSPALTPGASTPTKPSAPTHEGDPVAAKPHSPGNAAATGAAELEKIIFGDTPAPDVDSKRARKTKKRRQVAKPATHQPNAPTAAPNAGPKSAESEITGEIPDFIETYAECHDVIELPREVHRAIAVGLLGAALNDKGILIPNGAVTHTMDVWQVILTPSGGGRSTSFGFAEDLLASAGDYWKGLVQKIDWASPQAMKQSFANNQAAFYMWGEFGEKMRKLKSSQFGGMIQWWTDRYDSRSIPDTVVHRKRDYQDVGDEHTKVVVTADMPDVGFTFAPRSNFLASSSHEWFYNNIAQEDSFGGFIPRWMLWDIRDKCRSIPHPLPIRQELKVHLVRFLQKFERVIKDKSIADFSAVKDRYDDWYRAAEQRFKQQPNAGLAEAFWNRHRTHILKLAVVCELSTSCSLKLSPTAWQRAVEMAKTLETTIFRMLQTGMDKEGFQRAKMMEFLLKKGEEGCPWSQFSHVFERIRDHRDVAVHYNGLGSVVCFKKETDGRPAAIVVHHKFATKHQAKFPQHTPAHLIDLLPKERRAA